MKALTTARRDSLLHLLSRPFPGRDELLAQLDHAFVVGSDLGDPTFAMEVLGGPKAITAFHVPVDAVGPDEDGHPVHVLLHVVDGYLGEVEVYREDLGRVQQMPRTGLLELTVHPIEG